MRTTRYNFALRALMEESALKKKTEWEHQVSARLAPLLALGSPSLLASAAPRWGGSRGGGGGGGGVSGRPTMAGVQRMLDASLAVRDEYFHAKAPHEAFDNLVHVTGTNGKGSVALKIANGIARRGFSVGLYTSPHIGTIRERIKVNGRMIEEEEFAYQAERLLALKLPLSFFESVTMIALMHFQGKQVESVSLFIRSSWLCEGMQN